MYLETFFAQVHNTELNSPEYFYLIHLENGICCQIYLCK